MYPIFLKIENKPCLVVGGGKVATRKVRDLVDEGAKVTVVAPMASEELVDLAEKKVISLEIRNFRHGETLEYFLVIAATNDHDLNRFISEEAGTTKLFNSGFNFWSLSGHHEKDQSRPRYYDSRFIRPPFRKIGRIQKFA
jgi:siroheme synthase-like protein